MPITTNYPQGSKEWLDDRKKGIGSSEIPAIEGLSPYMTSRDVYLQKHGLKEIQISEYLSAKGHETEKIARANFEKEIGLSMSPICFTDSQVDYFKASLDGFHPSKGVLECKFVGSDVLKKALNGEIQPHHRSQVQWQMAVAECDVALLYCHDGKKNGVVVTVREDKSYQGNQRDLGHKWWDNFKARIEPALSDSDDMEIDAELMNRLCKLKNIADNAEEEFKILKNAIINKYGHTRLRSGKNLIYKSIRQGNINYKAIPAIAAMTTEELDGFRGKPSETWTFKTGDK